MIESEDWGKLYYAIIRTTKANKIQLIGIGSTKLICRNSALNHILSIRNISEKYARMLENLDLGSTSYSLNSIRYSMVYCEAKVYIYGKRYGYEGMNLVYDPTYREDLIRFAGYTKKKQKE